MSSGVGRRPLTARSTSGANLDASLLEPRLDRGDDLAGQLLGALAAFAPMRAGEGVDAMLGAEALDRLVLGGRVGAETVDGDERADAEALHVDDVAAEIGEPGFERGQVLAAEILLLDPAVHLERAHRGDDDRGRGREPARATLDVEELLGAEIGAETGLGHDDVGQAQRRPRRHILLLVVVGLHDRAVDVLALARVVALPQGRHRSDRDDDCSSHWILLCRRARGSPPQAALPASHGGSWQVLGAGGLSRDRNRRGNRPKIPSILWWSLRQ